MAHVHNEYLEEEVEDQGDVQMEMIVESTNSDIPVLSDAADNAKETLKENEKMEIRSDTKSTILVSDDSHFQ